VAQQRDAASRAQEADIQAKLDEAFQIRQTQQLEDLIGRAKAARADSDFDKALEVLATIGILYPGQPEARALEGLCDREKGRQLEANGDYAAAVAAFGRAVAIAPDDTAAVAGQLRARITSERLVARGVILQRQAWAASDTAADSSDTGPALAGPRGAAIGKPSKKGAGTPERRVEIESRRAATPGSERPRLSPEREREVEKLYVAGLAAMSERRVDDALRYWELAWSMDPGYKRLAEYLKREYLIRGMEFFASGKLDEAMSYWQKALQMDPADTRAASYIARARTQQARTRELTGEGR
jgi:tetratricopeptide (TPR) repeat protein